MPDSFLKEHEDRKGYWINELKSLGKDNRSSLGHDKEQQAMRHDFDLDEMLMHFSIEEIIEYVDALKQKMYHEYKNAYGENPQYKKERSDSSRSDITTTTTAA